MGRNAVTLAGRFDGPPCHCVGGPRTAAGELPAGVIDGATDVATGAFPDDALKPEATLGEKNCIISLVMLACLIYAHLYDVSVPSMCWRVCCVSFAETAPTIVGRTWLILRQKLPLEY